MPVQANKGRERFDRAESSDTNHDWLLPLFSALHVLSSYFPGSGIRSRPASLMSTMKVSSLPHARAKSAVGTQENGVRVPLVVAGEYQSSLCVRSLIRRFSDPSTLQAAIPL